MIVLDASVVIAYLDAENAHHKSAVDLLLSALGQDLRLSPVTLAEILVLPIRNGQSVAVRTALADIGISEIPFSASAGVRLAELRASTGLKMPDCCVLLAAIEAGGTVASFDKRLLASAVENGLATLGG